MIVPVEIYFKEKQSFLFLFIYIYFFIFNKDFI